MAAVQRSPYLEWRALTWQPVIAEAAWHTPKEWPAVVADRWEATGAPPPTSGRARKPSGAITRLEVLAWCCNPSPGQWMRLQGPGSPLGGIWTMTGTLLWYTRMAGKTVGGRETGGPLNHVSSHLWSAVVEPRHMFTILWCSLGFPHCNHRLRLFHFYLALTTRMLRMILYPHCYLLPLEQPCEVELGWGKEWMAQGHLVTFKAEEGFEPMLSQFLMLWPLNQSAHT